MNDVALIIHTDQDDRCNSERYNDSKFDATPALNVIDSGDDNDWI